MAIGPNWSKGNHDEYVNLENYFNATTGDHDGLRAFAAALRDPDGTANVMCERARLFADHIPAAARPQVRASFARIAQNWYGDGGEPMWHRSTRTHPAEMHRVTCASEAFLADLLVAGAAGCEFYGQCNHPEYETWITWPLNGFIDEYVKVFRYTGDNYLYNRAMYPPAVTLTMEDRHALANLDDDVLQALQQFKAADVRKHAAAANADLIVELRARRRALHLPVGAGDQQQLDDAVRDAENALIEQLAQHPDPKNTAFKGTALAIADDRGLRLIGDVRVQYLEDFLSDPREPALNQPPAAMFTPAGAPAQGVRFRWDRTLPGAWPAYPPIATRAKTLQDLLP